ncbi:MAG TPA: CDP-alcohol phosphatidyltransferase family protein [Acidobacteriota bacterium]
MLGIVYLPKLEPEAPNPAVDRVAGLVPLRRLALTLHSAGCDRVWVVTEEPPQSRVAQALRGIPELELRAGGAEALADLLGDAELTQQPIVLADGRMFISRFLPAGLSQVAGEGSAAAIDAAGRATAIAWLRAAASAAVAHRLRSAPGGGIAPALAALLERGLASAYRPEFPEFAAQVESRSDLIAATRKLYRSIYKPTDNLYARMNRRISLPLTRLLLPTPMTANWMTVLTLGVGVAAGLLMARGEYWGLALGAVLSWLAAVLDGCDGEIARLKFEESSLGCWLDSLADYAYYFFFFGGLVAGLYRQTHAPWVLWAGASTLSGVVAGQLITAWQRRRYGGTNPSGFATMVQQQLDKRSSENRGAFLMKWINQYAKRSTMPFWGMVVIVCGGAEFLLWMAAICTWWYFLGALFVRRYYPRTAALVPRTAPLATKTAAVAPARRPMVP